MADKKVRMTVEFSIDEEALQEHGLSAEQVLSHLTFNEDDVADGFRISTNIPGISPVSNFFLCEGKVISQGFVQEWVKNDGLDAWRRMVVDEIDLNHEIYGLSASEKDALLDDVGLIDNLAEAMELCMQRGDRNEYDALELVFQNDFPGMVDEFREGNLERLAEGLGLFCDASIHGSTLFVDCWKGDSVEIFLADDGELMCLLPDEDSPRALREKIQDVEPGDAFLFGGGGSIRTASEAAHQNFDEPDNPWILFGDDGECYFEEDFGRELGANIREILEKVKADLEPVDYPVQYPLQNYDDAVGHLCEVLNRFDFEMDMDDVRTPIKINDFVPIFKSDNYFGVFCLHADRNYEGEEEYYLVDRNNGEHKMVLGNSFEFVGKNLVDCMKDEKILNVANTEFLRYLVDGALHNVQDVIPEQDMRGIAVLEAALREAVQKEGKFMMGPSLMETLDAAKVRSSESISKDVDKAKEADAVGKGL